MCKTKCPNCDYKWCKLSLERHVKQKHTTEICNFCAKVFKGGIDRHIQLTICYYTDAKGSLFSMQEGIDKPGYAQSACEANAQPSQGQAVWSV